MAAPQNIPVPTIEGKLALDHVEQSSFDHEKGVLSKETLEEALDLPQKEIDRIYWKMDLRIVPPVAFIYLLQYADKSVIGNAKLEGLQTQLGLSSNDYVWVLSAFYFTYGLFEPLSNLLLKKIRAKIYLPFLCVAFGVNLALMSLVTNYAGLIVARVFLGITTAGVYPGAAYLFTLFYPREKLAFRFSIFFCSVTFSGAFTGLLAAAIANLSGTMGRLGWSWIFCIMGCIAIAGGLLVAPFMYNDPSSCGFLTAREKSYVLARIAKSQGLTSFDEEPENRINKPEILKAFLDWQTWSWLFGYFATTTPSFSLAIFIPSIVSGLGYRGSRQQLMGVPCFAAAVPFVVLTAWLSDRYKRRAPFLVVMYLVALIGWIMLATADRTSVRYGALYFCTIGTYSQCAPFGMAVANSFAGRTKRATAIAIIFGLGSLAGIITANLYPSKDAPRYLPGIHGMLFFAGGGLVQVLILWFTYARINANRERKLRELGPENYTQEQAIADGDRALTFRYIF